MRNPSICLTAAACLLASAAFAQTQTTTVIFIGDMRPANSGDAAILAYLEGRYGKKNVTYQDTEPANTVTAATILGYDVCVLSSTPSSGRYRNRLQNSPTPIVNMEEAMADDTPIGQEFSITAGRTKDLETGHAVTITAAHPITKGFAVNSKVVITDSTPNVEVWWSTGAQAPGAKSLAVDDDTATNMFITYVDVGDQLLDSTRKASCRRVMFGMTDRTFNAFTAAGKQLFGQSVDWAAGGCCAQWSNYGQGVAGFKGMPTIVVDNPPKWGTAINIIASNTSGKPAPGLLLISQQRAALPFLGGTVHVTPTFPFNLPVAVNGLTIRWAIPDLSSLCPTVPRAFNHWYFQLLQVDIAAKNGIAFSPGLRVELGK